MGWCLGLPIFKIVMFWPRSSMDRMSDSGSADWSSSLHGVTYLFIMMLTIKAYDQMVGVIFF